MFVLTLTKKQFSDLVDIFDDKQRNKTKRKSGNHRNSNTRGKEDGFSVHADVIIQFLSQELNY